MNKKNLQKKFLDIYDAYVSDIFRYCLYKLSNRENAEDLTQESFVRFWKLMEKGENIENPRAYLYRIAGNLIIDFYRKKKNLSLDQLSEKGFDKGYSDKDEVEAKIDSLAAVKELRKINEEYSEAVFMRYVGGLSVKEIAIIMKKSENSVSVCIHRGIKKMKDINKKIDI